MRQKFQKIFFALGILSLFLAVFLKFVFRTAGNLADFSSGFGLGAVSVFFIFTIYMHKFPKKAHQYEIAKNDERNLRIMEKSAVVAWYTSVLTLVIAEFIFSMLNDARAALIVGTVLMVHLVNLAIGKFFYNKQM